MTLTWPSTSLPKSQVKSLIAKSSSDSCSTSITPSTELEKKPALEIWSLYSYNLHKATYEGLNELQSRKGRRNFIVGRGSFAGQQRYAALWTGDNASTWDHLQVSINQVLSLGLSGHEIVGGDIGGFFPGSESSWADPELYIRWYCASVLLPWLRNHYHGKPGMKLFQEPWAFTDNFNRNPSTIPAKDRYLWLAVEPVCRYYIKLRYTLLQLLYDAMFDYQFTSLPIVRPLVVTDPNDLTLLGDNEWCLDNQYMAGADLLVCPVLEPETTSGGGREIYLPQTNDWYPFNLGIELNPRLDSVHPYGTRLRKKLRGGSRFFVDAHLSANDSCVPNICPMFIREG